METFSALLALCAGNSLVTGEYPSQRPVMRSFDVFFDLRPNKQLSKQLRGWWFETPSCSSWRQCNAALQWLRQNLMGAISLSRYQSQNCDCSLHIQILLPHFPEEIPLMYKLQSYNIHRNRNTSQFILRLYMFNHGNTDFILTQNKGWKIITKHHKSSKAKAMTQIYFFFQYRSIFISIHKS